MNNKFTLKTVYGTVRSNKLYSHNGIRYNLNPVTRDGAPMNVNVTAIIER